MFIARHSYQMCLLGDMRANAKFMLPITSVGLIQSSFSSSHFQEIKREFKSTHRVRYLTVKYGEVAKRDNN